MECRKLGLGLGLGLRLRFVFVFLLWFSGGDWTMVSWML